MGTYTLLGISGSLRQGSVNSMLVREAARLFDPAAFTFADLRLPLYNADVEDADGIPQAVRDLHGQILAADAVVISTPEYNKGPSGVLKNALDWVSRERPKPFEGKPVAIMSAGGKGGGELAQYILRGYLTSFQPHVLTGPQVIIRMARSQFTEDGRLKSDADTETLGKLMAALRARLEDQA